MQRGSGILLPVFSLPSKYGIGTFGVEAKKFIKFLELGKQKYWQMLPLNPTSYGDSPYQSFSAFAINPYFIDLDILIKEGYLTKEDVKPLKKLSAVTVDYEKLYQKKFFVLRTAYVNSNLILEEKIGKFIKKNKKWLTQYAAYMVIKELNDNMSWNNWPKNYKKYSNKIVDNVIENHQDEFYFWIWVQFIAYGQYKKIKQFAKRHHISIIGDMPLYVAADSADVWANRKQFLLNKDLSPSKVAGVPPDYFSSLGQLWGNPLYNYEVMKKNNYRWWRDRISHSGKLFDVIRLDHFRGFDTYYAIDGNAVDATNGEWMVGPGTQIIDAINKVCKKCEIVAENLGDMFDSVEELRKYSKWMGLNVYQFAFEDEDLENDFLPHNFVEDSVAYIGTHDNDVLANYLLEHKNLFPFMKEYLKMGRDEDIQDTLIGSLMRSRARVAIFTIQDLLHLGKESRINIPGTLGGNWNFRLQKKSCSKELAAHLAAMVEEGKR